MVPIQLGDFSCIVTLIVTLISYIVTNITNRFYIMIKFCVKGPL